MSEVEKSSNGTAAEAQKEVKEDTNPSPAKKAKLDDVKEASDKAESTESKKVEADDKVKSAESEKTEASDEVESTESKEISEEVQKKIIRQIEYYFGDVNLGKDKFLQSLIKEDEGWVSMEIMLKFNRLSVLSKDTAAIIAALEKSTSGLMEISDDKSKIRRDPCKPLPENNQDRVSELKKRSLYVKGFPTDATLEELMEFFDGHGGSEHIAMRRETPERERKFKGSVFVIFTKVEDAKKFVETEEIKYKDEVLTKLFKDEYFKKKQEERRKHKEEEHTAKEEAKKAEEEEEREKQLKKITKGSILKVAGLAEGLKMHDLKEKFGEWGTVMWVDYEESDKMAKVRFDGEDSAKAAMEKAQEGKDKVLVNDAEVTFTIMEGDEEMKHWMGILAQRSERSHHRGRGRGRGRGGKRFGGRYHDGPSSKRSKRD